MPYVYKKTKTIYAIWADLRWSVDLRVICELWWSAVFRQTAENNVKMHQNTSFSHTKKNQKIFWIGDTAPVQAPSSVGRGHPSHTPSPIAPPRPDSGYATVAVETKTIFCC